MYKHISVGIVHWMAYPESRYSEKTAIEGIRRLASDSFFTALEICPVAEGIRKKAKDILNISNLKVNIGGGAPLSWNGLDLASLEEVKRREAVDFAKKLIEEAYFFCAPSLMLCTGPDPEESRRDKAKKQLVASLKQLCAYAEKTAKSYLLTITLENLDREIDKKRLIGPTVEAVEIANVLSKSYKNFGLTIDLAHLPLLRETPMHAIQTAKEYIRHVHIGNCVVVDKNHPSYGDQHPPFGILGGETNVEEVANFLRNLDRIGYFKPGNLPTVSCEIKPRQKGNAKLVIANAKRTLRQAWLLAFS